MDESRGSEETPLVRSEEGDTTVYGTFSVKGEDHWISPKPFVELYKATLIPRLSCYFSGLRSGSFGFQGCIGLSSEGYVFMHIMPRSILAN